MQVLRLHAEYVHSQIPIIVFFLLGCFYFWWRVKRPTKGSACDIICPGEHGLLAPMLPWVPTAAEADPHLDPGSNDQCLSEGE